MPRSCSICTHSKTSAITKTILGGASNKSVADRFGVTASAVQRHRTGCLRSPRKETVSAAVGGDKPALASPRFESATPQELVAGTARLVDEALELLEHAKDAGDRKTALAALREARDGLALLMRASGMLAGDGSSTTIIDQRKQSIQVLSGLTIEELRALAAPVETC